MVYKNFELDPKALRAWARRMGFDRASAAAALGMSMSAYGSMLATEKANRPRSAIGLRTAYACAAIEAGIEPIGNTGEDLQAWMERMSFTWDDTVLALDLARSNLAKFLNEILTMNRRMALACAAIEAGLKPVKGPRIKA
jgi:hypothetical protein